MIRIDARAAENAKPDADGITVMRGKTDSGDPKFVAWHGEHCVWASTKENAVREIRFLQSRR